MAEAVLGVLIGRLGEALLSEAGTYCASLLCIEYSALRGLFGEIRKAVDLLSVMKAYIKDSKKSNNTSKTTDVFNKKIQGLAFRIEDVVDEFKYKLEDHKNGGFAAKMNKRIRHVKVWHRLATELRNINADLKEAAEHKDIFARHGGDSDHRDEQTNPTLCFAREEDLVGIEDNAKKLKDWVLDSLEEKKSRVITVWGMGGTGKTTLVDHVYKNLKGDFDVAVWLTVSKSYHVEDLLNKIAGSCGVIFDGNNMDLRSQVEVIRNQLDGKRCFFVVDDVWEIDLWMNILDVFPSNCVSRLILTSRKFEIASLATNNCAITLKPLEDYLSWKLFCNLVFWNNDDRRCPPELQVLATKFLQQCEGLPLAIACMGRLLSCKPVTYSAWKNVYEDLEFQWTKHVKPGVHSILKVSLDDLSYELKSCFLHCALFPEDYELKRGILIKHWITAGFIKEKGNKRLEEVAEDYLNELVNRSLLQVIQKNEVGRVRYCRMHDIIRHLALDKAEEECFGKIYKGSRFSSAIFRRLSIQSANISPLHHCEATHIRAIFTFTRYLDVDSLRPILASSSLMSMLDLCGTQVKVLPNEVFNMFNLRYLGIRFTKIEILPEAIGRLQNLEVLDALATGLVSLPKGLAKLKKLWHLYASKLVIEKDYRVHCGVKVPRGIRNLTGLCCLNFVKASLETLHDLAALTNLRSVAVHDVTRKHTSTLCAAIMNWSHLVHLGIHAADQNEILSLEVLPLPKTLSKLELNGQLEKKWIHQILSSLSHLSNLVCLYLGWSKIDDQSFSKLLMLHNLCKLHMDSDAYYGTELHFPVHTFPKLRELGIYGASQLKQVVIEEGALENLVQLDLTGCPELKCAPRGIEYLTSLEELYLKDTSKELIDKLRQKRDVDECNEELMKINHIRKVIVELTEEGIWERIC